MSDVLQAWIVVCVRRTEVCGHLRQRLGHFLFVGAGDGFKTVEVGTATGAAGTGVGCVFAGEGVANGAGSGTPDCRTELVPVMAGNDSTKANSINPAAAPIVIFDSSVCVPLGPNAVLDTELENSAPASAFPG